MISCQDIRILYIDPGTGSMLIAVAMGIFTTLIFACQGLFVNLKMKFGAKKSDAISKDKLNYVIFSDHKRYWNVFKLICDDFERRGIEVHFWTQSEDDPALSEKYEYVKTEFIGEGNKGFYRLNMMNARICLSTTPDLDVTQWKRSKSCDRYVHIFHSSGLNIGGYKMFGIDFYDDVLTCNDSMTNSVREIEDKRGIKNKNCLSVGTVYFDNLNERLQKEKKLCDEKIVLLAPSWGPNGALRKYGRKIIDLLVESGYKIIIRPHPQMLISEKEILDDLMNEYKDIEWNFDNDNFDVLNKSSILVSDFSGVIYDYSIVFDKPVLYLKTEFDYSQYDYAWFDENVTLSVLPKIGKEINDDNIGNLKEIIDESINSNEMKESRANMRDLIWINRGNSKNLIVDYLVDINNYNGE